MKIILTCGHPYSGHDKIGELLHSCGVSKALPSLLELYTPETLQSKIFEVCEWSTDGSSNTSLPALGKMWQELASSLLIANLSQPIWGWTDSQTVWLLEFWKDFDPQIRFILVYSSPEFVLCNMLQHHIDAPNDIDSLLIDWNRYNTELLRFYNRNQDRCLLINAQTSLQYPQTLIAKLSEAFGIDIQSLEENNNILNTSCIAAGLACNLINHSNPTNKNSLYQELESTADIISSGFKPSTKERLQAWSEYNRLISELKNTTDLSEQQQKEIIILKAQQIELEQQNYKKQQELELENELLNLQLHKIQEEIDQQLLDNKELYNKEIELSNVIKEKQQEIETLKANTISLNNTINAKQQEIETLKANTISLDNTISAKQQEIDTLKANTISLDNTISAKQQEIDNFNALQTSTSIKSKQELEQENELLLLQLHQLQEELEHYFLEYKKVNNSISKFDYDLIGISLDPRKNTFSGNNWYYAEHDGRWSGPNTSSTINIPPLLQGKDYEIVLDIIGSQQREIIDGMQASINGKPITIQHPKPLSVWKRRFKKEKYSYPCKLRMYFSALDMDDSPLWVLKLDFPKVISPAESGGDIHDKRKLAIRLHNISIKQI